MSSSDLVLPTSQQQQPTLSLASEVPVPSSLPLTHDFSREGSRRELSSMAIEDDREEAVEELAGGRGRQAGAPPRQVAKVLDRPGLRIAEEFETFLMDYQVEGHNIYRARIIELETTGKTTLWVNFTDLLNFNEGLARAVQVDYVRFEPFMFKALLRCVEQLVPAYLKDGNMNRDFMIAFSDVDAHRRIRELKTDYCGKLISFSATVTRTSIVRPELVDGTFQCEDCDEIVPGIKQQFVYTRPQQCPNDLCNNMENWKLLVEKCRFVDWQKCRVQENSHEIPAGSVPRSIDVIVRHEMCEKPKPGDTCVFTGTLIAVPDVAQLMMAGRHLNSQKALREATKGNKDSGVGGQGVSGLKALGCREMSFKLIFIAIAVSTSKDKYAHYYEEGISTDDVPLSDTIAKMLSPAEREQMLEMIDSKTNYEDLISSICPTIYGHSRIKEGLLLLLLGGVHKRTPEGTNKLRGDINVCVVGDPGLSKSQFLKYIASLLPRGIYTSGKASSAAGLTAAVMKDEETGDFCIEAGALMLADNGICCIDEFDKMDIRDQVAIHEAMEQQTISIAKAGIHATLNARTSILAAANPVGGRYDKSKSLRYNVNMSAPIMSRFDLFFVVLDEVNEEHDFALARHILKVNRDMDEAIQPKYDTDALRRFVLFARALRPRLTAGAKDVLVKKYLALRQKDSQGKNGYHITVRQLESLIRLSEAMARAQIDSEVKEKHVRAAASLLQNSIIQTEKGDIEIDEEQEQVENAEVEMTAEGGDVPADAQQQQQQPEKMKLKAEEYMSLVRSILALLREKELRGQDRTLATGADIEMTDEEQQNAAEAQDSVGMTFQEICMWYLEKCESILETEDDYRREFKKIRNVVKRMVKHDRYLMAVKNLESIDNAEDYEPVKIEDETVLVVSPSVSFDELTL